MLERVGRYRIDSVLGQGAMGTVYKAFDPHVARAVALKTLHKGAPDDCHRQMLVSRFRQEAQAAGRLSHPNIVAVHDSAEDGDIAYIAMEFAAGIDLDSHLQRPRPHPLPKAIGWMQQLLLALHHAHARGVVHRDVKPSNLIITADGQLKVTDFGIARLDTALLTQAGAMIGTPCYMSPEQCRGEPVDGRSDLFSAGIVLYLLLTGKRPFSGSAAGVMQQILSQPPVPPSSLEPTLDPQFDLLVSQALAKHPDDRFATALEFFHALQALACPPTDDDRTWLQGQAACSQASPARVMRLDYAFVQACETRLTYLIGPIARIVVAHALTASTTPHGFLQALATHIVDDAQRHAFLQAEARP